MTKATRRTLLAAAALAPWSLRAAAAGARSFYWPTGAEWASAPPSDAGFDPAVLDAAVRGALADDGVGAVVLRHGRIVAEAYAPGGGASETRELASAAKSVVSVLVGVAIDQGHIRGIDQSASDFIPQWKGTPKQAITIRHMLTMTSGLHFQGLAIRGITGDQLALDAAAGLDEPPGRRWAYATPIFHLLYHVVEIAAGEPFEAFAQRNLIGPLGMQHWSWVTNVGRGANGPVRNYYTARCSARDLARFGLFALRGGRWNNRQLVSADYFRAATTPSQSLNPCYGYLWWLNAKPGLDAAGGDLGYRFPGSPPDTFAALGAGGQVAIETPSLDLVVVRQGTQPRNRQSIADFQAQVVAAITKRS